MRSESTGRTCHLPIRLLIAAGLALLLAACGKTTQLHPGYPVMTMSATNSGNSFASYIVGIDTIALTEQNGQVVYLSPTQQIVDLVRLADFSELVSAYSVPNGTYVSAALLLDYTVNGAGVNINLNGKAVAASVAGPGNAALGQVNVVVTFDKAKPLVVALQQATPVHVNFDLQAFNVINAATTIPSVTVEPYAILNPASIDSTPLRARGTFVTVQNGYIIMNLRPFYSFSSNLGAVLIYPTATTYYNVNGAVYTGAAGLQAMAGVQQTTVIVAYGTLTGVSGPDTSTSTNPTFTAKEIYVGTAQENGLSYVSGMVSARSGTSVTLRGVTVNYFSGTSFFTGGAAVTLDPAMPVSEDGVNVSGLSAQSISVGQSVYLSGTVNIDSNGLPKYDTAGNLLFDGTGGTGRLSHTRLWGTLTSSSPTTATFDLLSLGLYAPNGYNFAGTGSSTPADPAAYLVNTDTIDLSGTGVNTLMAIDGSTTAFGAAPPDFNATAVTAASQLDQTLVVEWPAGEIHPFSSASSSGYVIDLTKTSIGSIHYVYSGPAAVDLKALTASPLVTTTGADQNNLQLSVGSINVATGISMFATPGAYYTGVTATFNGTNKIYRFVATGRFNIISNTFVASRITMSLL